MLQIHTRGHCTLLLILSAGPTRDCNWLLEAYFALLFGLVILRLFTLKMLLVYLHGWINILIILFLIMLATLQLITFFLSNHFSVLHGGHLHFISYVAIGVHHTESREA